ncbi:hypothetical protein Rhopal_001841-T1 [Rhodotorula paludigena]|uniref:Uncharacterized protein n=1 Tax=Rhodotorula paludigena TaxID=86838 RepID=A0AAV5GGK5_9BASI|nr:hypothetical protein Rhopal_001841-T1 [Rhodotorula paludigena]
MPPALPAEIVELAVRQLRPCSTLNVCPEVHGPPLFCDPNLATAPQGRWPECDCPPEHWEGSSCTCCPACRFAPLLTCGLGDVEAATRRVHQSVISTQILKGLADRVGPHCLTERGLWVVPFASSVADLVSNVAAGSPALAGVRIAQFALAPVRNLIDFADDSDSAVALSNTSMRREMASFGFTIAPFAVYLPDVAPLLSTLASQLTTLCVTDGGSFEVARAVSAAGGTFPRVTTLAVGVLSRWNLVDALLKACPALELLVVVNALAAPLVVPARHPQLVAVHWLTGDRDETSLQVRLASAVLPSDFSFLDGTVHVDLGPGSAWRASPNPDLELWQSLATVMSSDAT